MFQILAFGASSGLLLRSYVRVHSGATSTFMDLVNAPAPISLREHYKVIPKSAKGKRTLKASFQPGLNQEDKRNNYLRMTKITISNPF